MDLVTLFIMILIGGVFFYLFFKFTDLVDKI
jgi:hypothetical protein